MVITGSGSVGPTVTFGGVPARLCRQHTTLPQNALHMPRRRRCEVVASGESTKERADSPTRRRSRSATAWVGYALAHPPLLSAQVRPFHSDMDMRLTVANNVLTSFTCGGSAVAFAQAAISNGEFSLAAEFIPITGRIVAPNEVIGTISTAACPATLWYASRQ